MALPPRFFLLVLYCHLMPSLGFASLEPPAVPAPGAVVALDRDTCANYWALTWSDGRMQLLVLPAPPPHAWQPFTPAGIPLDQLVGLRGEPDGTVILVGRGRQWSFDPRRPAAGAQPPATPAGASPAWRIVARMPASNHDLSAAVLGSRFYVGGGVTSEWGFPPRTHAFDELWCFATEADSWRVAARLGRERIYCATATFGAEVWIVGGVTIDADGQRRASTLVERFVPADGTRRAGPELARAQPQPVALVGGDRLYVIGAAEKESPGRMESIGPGESTWRVEPDGPLNMWALAGCTWHDVLYLAVPRIGLVAFDPARRHWDILGGPAQPRSPEMATWRDEIWIIGGRDTTTPTAVHIYNPRSRTWRLGPAFPRELAWGAAAVVGDRFFVTGGAAGPGFTDRTYELAEK